MSLKAVLIGPRGTAFQRRQGPDTDLLDELVGLYRGMHQRASTSGCGRAIGDYSEWASEIPVEDLPNAPNGSDSSVLSGQLRPVTLRSVAIQ